MKEPPQHGSAGGQNEYDQHRECKRHVKFVIDEKGNPPGKLTDAELHFSDGVLAGLKRIGFGVCADPAAAGT